MTTIEAAYRARTPRSAALHEEARCLFPGGATRSVTLFEPHPVYIASGRGCRVVDVDFNEYLDVQNNFGSMVHGHAHPAIVAAIECAGHARHRFRVADRAPSRARARDRVAASVDAAHALHDIGYRGRHVRRSRRARVHRPFKNPQVRGELSWRLRFRVRQRRSRRKCPGMAGRCRRQRRTPARRRVAHARRAVQRRTGD